MTDKRIIEYRFLHWGPFVCSYSLSEKEVTKLKKLKSKEDHNSSLAGHLEYQKVLDKIKVFEFLIPYLNSYVQAFFEHRGKPLANGFELESCWINRQKKNEFNPPHIHDGDLSFIIYTEIPEGLEKECKNSVSKSPGPGSITFDFNITSPKNQFFLQSHAYLPSVGDMFIFPAGLPHWVFPFKTTEGERVSISGNIKLK